MNDAASPDRYWDGEVEKARAEPADGLWYRYMQAIYGRLIGGLAGPLSGPSLKTDLYEEAVAEHAPLLDLPGPRFGIDVAPAVVAAAREGLRARGARCTLAVADVRRLPFADGAFGLVLSGSTLDHFEDARDLRAGLAELARGPDAGAPSRATSRGSVRTRSRPRPGRRRARRGA